MFPLQELPQTIIAMNPSMRLSEWLIAIDKLIKTNCTETILYTESSYNNCCFFMSTKRDNKKRIDQSYMDSDCRFKLKEWRTALIALINEFGSEMFMYTEAEECSVQLFISPPFFKDAI